MSTEPVYVTAVNPTGAVVYQSASTDAPKLESVFLGDALKVIEDAQGALAKIGQEGEWIKVETHKGTQGYIGAWIVQRAFVAPPGRLPAGDPHAPPPITPPPDDDNDIDDDIEEGPELIPTPPAEAGDPVHLRTTATDGLRVRQGPGTEYQKIGQIYPSDKVQLLGDIDEGLSKLEKSGEWLPIQFGVSDTGWSSAKWLEKWPKYITSPVGHALAGLHGPADPAKWPWDGDAYNIVSQARMEAIKLMAGGDMDGEVVQNLHARGVKFVMARLFAQFWTPRSPKSFCDEVTPSAKRLFNAGVRYFEVHNEPNLHHQDGPEGMWVAWHNGKEFGDFLLETLNILRERIPGALFGWPGLSPGDDINGPDGKPLRYSSQRFLEEADFAARECDFICLHTYWTHDGIARPLEEIKFYCERFPDKMIAVTEFSNPSHEIGKDIKGHEYVQYYKSVKALPPNLGAVFSYIMSASGGYTAETWKGTPIPGIVGNR